MSAEPTEQPEYDKVTQASLNGIYVKAQELDRGHNVYAAPAFAPPGSFGGPGGSMPDAVSHASQGADAVSHASASGQDLGPDVLAYASQSPDAEAHASTHASDAPDAEAHASTHASDG